jgi:hypothetical protein
MVQSQAQTLTALKSQVEALRTRTEANAEAVAATAQQMTTAAGPGATAEPPKTVTSGEEKVSLSLSGQVNRGILFVDDGTNSEVFHVDNDNSSTRFRMVGKARVTDDISLGTEIEVQMESNSTGDVNQESDNGVGGTSFTERKLEFYADSKRFGRAWVGQGSTASDGTSEVDLSGTTVVGYSSIGDMAGGMKFVDTTTNSFGPAIKNVFSNLDGLGRDDRIRYDTPTFAGFQGSVSHVSGGAWDVGLRYAAKYGSFKTAAAVGYANNSSISSTEESRINGSVSALHDSGLNATFAAGSADTKGSGRDDKTFIYGKLGYTADFFDIGSTAFAVDFMQADDVSQNDDEATSYGLFGVQNLEEYGTQIYLGARNHELDRTGSSFDDVFALISGARVKF